MAGMPRHARANRSLSASAPPVIDQRICKVKLAGYLMSAVLTAGCFAGTFLKKA